MPVVQLSWSCVSDMRTSALHASCVAGDNILFKPLTSLRPSRHSPIHHTPTMLLFSQISLDLIAVHAVVRDKREFEKWKRFVSWHGWVCQCIYMHIMSTC